MRTLNQLTNYIDYIEYGSPNKAAWVRQCPDIRRSKSLGVTGDLRSKPGMKKTASPNTAVMLS